MNRCSVLISLALCAIWHAGPTLGQSQIDINILTRLENLEKQVSRQQNQLEVQNNLIADLQARVTVQESAIAKQHATINVQQTTIVEQQKTMSKQQLEIIRQQSSLSEQHHRLTKLEGMLMAHRTNKGNWTKVKMNAGSSKIDGQEDAINNSFQTHTGPVAADKDEGKSQERNTKHTIRRLNKRLVLESGSPIAFHAVNTAGENAHVGVGQNIMFPKVMLNLGAGFHNQHGVFIAPAPGLYIFSTSIMSYVGSHSEIKASVLKNGAVLARVFTHGDSGREDQGSVTVVTQLAVGDEVWVSESSPADASYYGGYFTSFTGCLLWPL